tara:strand:+ start:2652 stop:3389 length:738 start_codon:yes stop_codon:yes gene_type:complete
MRSHVALHDLYGDTELESFESRSQQLACAIDVAIRRIQNGKELGFQVVSQWVLGAQKIYNLHRIDDMIFDDPLALCSSPRDLFDQLLARCVRAACVNDVTRLNKELSWLQFMQIHAIAVNAMGDAATPAIRCLVIPEFVFSHPDRPTEETRYAIFSLPTYQSFVIVSSKTSWRAFGKGADNLLMMITCTPSPCFAMVNTDQEFSFPNGAHSNQTALIFAMSSESFVNLMVNARRRALGMHELETS